MTFETDMNRIANKIGSDLEEFGFVVKFKLFKSIIDDTRVDTGRARMNWQATEDAPTGSTLKGPGKRSGGESRESRAVSAGEDATRRLQSIEGIGVTYLTNNLPYIRKLEQLDAMAGKNVARIQQIIRRALGG
jgi:hypothetical protein